MFPSRMVVVRPPHPPPLNGRARRLGGAALATDHEGEFGGAPAAQPAALRPDEARTIIAALVLVRPDLWRVDVGSGRQVVHRSYKRMKDRWDGWSGKNAARVEQRRASEQQRDKNASGASKRAAAEASRASALPPAMQADAAFLDARAATMAASVLGAIGDDGLVVLCSMEHGPIRRQHPSHRCPHSHRCRRTRLPSIHGRWLVMQTPMDRFAWTANE